MDAAKSTHWLKAHHITGPVFRQIRQGDAQRGKGKRGGLRVVYFWWGLRHPFWLFTLYDKDEMDDLSPQDRAALKTMLKLELEKRK